MKALLVVVVVAHPIWLEQQLLLSVAAAGRRMARTEGSGSCGWRCCPLLLVLFVAAAGACKK